MPRKAGTTWTQERDRLSKAYRSVFFGNASREEAMDVLADFANHCGFHRVTMPVAGTEQLWHNEGMRAAFFRIYDFLRMSEDEIRELEMRAHEEMRISSQEGEI